MDPRELVASDAEAETSADRLRSYSGAKVTSNLEKSGRDAARVVHRADVPNDEEALVNADDGT